MKKFNDTTTIKTLSELGIDDKQALIYLSALELGGGTVSDLASHCHIERTGIYYHLEKLLQLKLLKVAQHGKRSIYLPTDPDRLRNLIEQRQNKFMEILPSLQEQFSQKSSKSIIEYFEGIEEVDRFYDRVYELLRTYSNSDEAVYIFGNSYLTVIKSNSNFSNYHAPTEQINIKIQTILPKSQKNKDPEHDKRDPYIVSRYNLPPAQIKYVDDKYSYPGSIVITPNHIIQYDWRNLIFSITENKNNAATWRSFFELIWDQLK